MDTIWKKYLEYVRIWVSYFDKKNIRVPNQILLYSIYKCFFFFLRTSRFVNIRFFFFYLYINNTNYLILGIVTLRFKILKLFNLEQRNAFQFNTSQQLFKFKQKYLKTNIQNIIPSKCFRTIQNTYSNNFTQILYKFGYNIILCAYAKKT